VTSRRRLITFGVAALAVVATLAIARLRAPAEEVSGSFCQVYPSITDMTEMLQRGLEGEARPDDLSPANYRALAEIVWSDRVATGGPEEVDADAVRIATAVRRAAEDEEPASLQDPAVRRAIERVEPIARTACDRRDG
jgi:hypothetical protein